MHRPTRHGARKCARGFSLVELMATTALLALLGAMAMPSLENLINGNRLANASNEMLAFLNEARLEAITRHTRVDLCRSADGEHCSGDAPSPAAWMAYRREGDGVEVVAATRMDARIVLQLNQAATGWTGYDANGRMRTHPRFLSSGRMRLCIPTTRPRDNIRDVTIRASGRVEVTASSGNGECPSPAD
jgi:type IV fimbrial biogenesis protein FimT